MGFRLATLHSFWVGSLFFASSTLAVAVPFTDGTDAGGNRIRAIEPADMDGDGDLDLLYTSSTGASGIVAWLENDGTGTLGASTQIASGFNNARVVRAGDFDGDGDLDVVGASISLNDVVLWLNTAGDGTTWFPFPVDETFGNARGLTIGDFDLDGDLDVAATGSLAAGHLAWWKNLGASFSGRMDIEVGTLGLPRRVQSGDLDGDGDLDLIVALSNEGRIVWYRNDLPAMGTWTQFEVQNFFDGARDARPFDMDGDGDLDLLAVAGDENLVAWFENQDGLATTWESHVLPGVFSTATEAVAEDFDLDGDLDVVGIAASGPLDVSWWENLDGVGQDWTRMTIDSDFALGQAIVAADMDGDGDADVVGGSSDASTGIRSWSNETIHRSATFPFDHAIVTDDFSTVHHVAADDIDRDGWLDAVAADEAGGEVAWWRNPGTADAPWSFQSIGTSFAGARHVEVGDLDGDGDPDVVGAADGDDAVVWWRNDAGDGSAWTEHVIDPTFSGARFVALADYDRDGDLDVAAAAMDGNRIVWWGNADGTGTAWVQSPVDTNFRAPRCVRAADLDGDGDMDLLAASWSTGDLVWYENFDGAGSFAAAGTLGSASAAGYRRFVVVDFDRDGDPDVVAAATNEDRVVWFENTAGDASAWSMHDIDASYDGPVDVHGVDVDLDGDLDVVAASNVQQQVVWWENSAGDESTWILRFVDDAVSFPLSVDLGDLDRDGSVDVLGGAAFALDGTLRWWENRGGQFALAVTDAVVEPQPLEGAEVLVLEIDGAHRGRSPDADLELESFELRFTDGDGVPLDTATLASLVDAVRLYVEDGDPASWDGTEMELPASTPPTLDGDGVGVVTYSLPNGDLQITHGVDRTYWLTLDSAADAGSQTVDTLRVSHLGEADSSARMLGSGLAEEPPLLREYAAGVSSTVVAFNVAPIEESAVPNQVAVQDQTFELDLAAFVSDPDGDVLTFSVVDDFGFLALTADGLLGAAPDAGDVSGSPYTVEVTVSDDSTGQLGLSFQLAIDQPPTLIAMIGEVRVQPGVDPALDLSGSFDDADGDPLTFYASGLPGSLSLSPAGVLSGIPLESEVANSPYSVSLTAEDPYAAMATAMFDLVVNGAPEASSPLPFLEAIEGIDPAEDLSVYFSDPNSDPLTFTAIDLPGSLYLTADGVVRGSPSTYDVSLGTPFDVEVTAADGYGGEVTVELTITLSDHPEAILVDGFETGDLAGWSSSVGAN